MSILSHRRSESPIVDAHQRLIANLANPDLIAGWPRGVIGAVAASGEPRYGYPEIAGYWLHWASSRSEVSEATGTAVVGWLQSLRERCGYWPTRVVSSGSLSVDYAEARYLFDHAMLWDGLDRWGRLRHSPDARRLAERVWRDLDVFVCGGHPGAGIGMLPARWSGRTGPFLLKAAARFRARRGLPAITCKGAVPDWRRAALQQPHAEAHPQLYAIEGLIELGNRANARTVLRRLLRDQGGAEGLRESLDGGPRRSDILAQVLRAALLLQIAAPYGDTWHKLGQELAERVDECGRLPFARPGDDCPTWAALFAEQALACYLGAQVDVGDLV